MTQSLQIDVRKTLLEAYEAFLEAFDASIAHTNEHFRAKMRKKTMVPSSDFEHYHNAFLAAQLLENEPSLLRDIERNIQPEKFSCAAEIARILHSEDPLENMLAMLRSPIENQLPLSGFPWASLASPEFWKKSRFLTERLCSGGIWDYFLEFPEDLA